MRQSGLVALLRAWVHVLPVAFALYEIIINLDGQYLGANFQQQSAYQVVAKTHEILIGASLSTIVLSYLRSEVARGDGLPFGAFVSGLQFLSISYLWSREFWASIVTSAFLLRKKVFFVVLISTCTIIAAAAGPTSATLLLPRLTLWPVTETYFIMQSASQRLHPSQLRADQASTSCLTFSLECGSTSNSSCPAADWQQLGNAIHTGLNSTSISSATTNTGGQPYVKSSFQFGDESGPTRRASLETYSYNGNLTQVVANIVPETIAAAALGDYLLWLEQHGIEDPPAFLDSYHLVSDIQAPYTAVSCHSDTISAPLETVTLQFPNLLPGKGHLPGNFPATVPVESNFTIPSASTSEYQIAWMALPAGTFDIPASGAIILDPSDQSSESPQRITTCTCAAGWGSSILLSHSNEYGEFYTGPVSFDSSFNAITQGHHGSSVGTAMQVDPPFFSTSVEYYYPQGGIEVDTPWLETLNPNVTFTNGTETSAINYYLSLYPTGLSELQSAKVLSLMLITGLSKIGSDITYEGIRHVKSQAPPHYTDTELQYRLIPLQSAKTALSSKSNIYS